jgi:serine/threonine protein kinase
MTYADLGSLATLLHEGVPLPPGRAVDLVRQAGAGLSVLHEHGVVHRDIKPQNLLLRSGGSAGDKLLVADLGVAKAMLHASGLTQVVGTPSYMAPEQATGGGIDIRADVHALGAVAYQMLTGHLVRTGSISELAVASLPPAPSSLADLPRAVDDVLLRALEPDPANRWPDVESFVTALRRAVPTDRPVAGGEPTRLQVEATTISDPPQQSSRVLLALLCVLVFAAAFGASYALGALVR